MLKWSIFKNYDDFSFSKLNTDKYRHLKLLIFWPLYGLMFMFVEHFYQVDSYYTVYCSLDDMIPFNEWFFIPYMFWFVFLTGMVLYTVLFEIKEFRRMMHFIMMTYTFTIIVYLVFPTQQELRPEEFERDNIFTDGVKFLYTIDTNTNVCPSIHVIGSLGACFTLWNTKPFSNWILRILNIVTTILICLSTVFLKQHSVIDMITGLLISIAIYPVSLMILKKQFVRE